MLRTYPIYDIVRLLKLHPGVITNGKNYYVMGSLPFETSYYLDGVYINNPYHSLFSGYIPFASLERVQFSLGDGDPGISAAGGYVNLITKTGGDRLSIFGEIISDQFGLDSQPQTTAPFAFSYGYRLISASVGGPLIRSDLIRFYGSVEQFNMEDAEPTSSRIPLLNLSYLNPLNGLPDNGEPFTDMNHNTVWDENEPYIDSVRNNMYDRPNYSILGPEAVTFKYGPKSGNWVNRTSMNGNIVFDLKPLLGLDLNVKIGGSWYGNERSQYNHVRHLFNYYNDADTKNGIGTNGELKNRYLRSSSTTTTKYGRISGRWPPLKDGRFFIQISRYENRYEQFDPVLGDGRGHWLWDDGTVSEGTLPFLQYAKTYDYSNHRLIYQSPDGSYLEADDWLPDSGLTFIRTEYDTTWINPLYGGIGSPPYSLVKWAYYGVAGQPVTNYEKHILGHKSARGALQFEINGHDISTGFEYRKYDIRYLSVYDILGFGKFFLVNRPYSPDQDIYSAYSQSNIVYLKSDYHGDGIPDYLQDGSDSWDNEDVDGDGDIDHDDYFLEYMSDANSVAYIHNTGFDSFGRESAKAYSPVFGSWYINDALRFNRLSVELGLRYDYFDPANKILNPETGGIYNIVIDDDGELADVVYGIDQNLNGVLEPYEYQSAIPTLSDLKGKRQLIKAPVLRYWNPQIGLKLRFSKSTDLYFRYKTFATFPPLKYIDRNYRNFAKILAEGWSRKFPNPSLKASATSYFDLGFKKYFGSRIAIGVKLFYKFLRGIPQLNTINAEIMRYITFTNDFQTIIRGGILIFEFDGQNGVYSRGGFMLQSARGSVQDFYVSFNSANTFDRPVDQDQRLTIVTLFGYNDADRRKIFGINTSFLFRFDSGMRYTPTEKYGAIFNTNPYYRATGKVNSASFPFTASLDMKIERDFHINKFNLSVFIWGINILNRENILYVYPSTGFPDDDGYLSTRKGERFLEDYWNNDPEFGRAVYTSRLADPNNYGSPRQVRIGLNVQL